MRATWLRRAASRHVTDPFQLPNPADVELTDDPDLFPHTVGDGTTAIGDWKDWHGDVGVWYDGGRTGRNFPALHTKELWGKKRPRPRRSDPGARTSRQVAWGDTADPLADCTAWSDFQCSKRFVALAGASYRTKRPAYAEWTRAAGEIWSALRVMRERRGGLGVISYNTVIGIFGRWGRAQWVDQLLELMAEDGVRPDSGTYCGRMAAVARLGDAARTWQILGDMIAEGIEPDVGAWAVAAGAAAQKGDTTSAEAALLECERRGSVPNAALLNSVIAAQHGFAAAWRSLKSMEARGVKPDCFSFQSAAKASVRNASVREARRCVRVLIDEATAAGVADTGIFPAAASALFRAGDYPGVVALVKVALERDCVDDGSLGAVTLRACACLAKRKDDEHVKFAEAMFRRCEMVGVGGNQFVWTQMMGVYAAVGDADAAMRLRSQMDSLHMKQQHRFAEHLATACRKAGRDPPPPQGDDWRWRQSLGQH
eukprot:TRINITY_DN9142_c0_g1_i2.p1 TRINITY_DN9142_c0_g1~~TRINITY_DN9142_c0_g1_i2.p1  ORF type:complete len:498 (+),score=113.29 TRINITY_DN9142_c0_g1_i2:44-1495(+)